MSSRQFVAKVFRWLHQVNTDLTLPASATKVAVYLCSYFNEAEGGAAWPSCQTIATAIGLSEATVINVVRALHERGHLRIEWGKQGRGCSNRYWMIEKDPDQGELFEHEKPQPAKVFDTQKTSISEARKPQFAEKKPQSDERKPQPAKETLSKTLRRSIEGEERLSAPDCASREEKRPSDETNLLGQKTETEPKAPKKKQQAERRSAAADDGEAFARFYAAYPRKIGKEGARRAHVKAIKRGVAPERIQRRAEVFAVERQGQDPQYTPYPATWLNGCRYDDPLPDGVVLDHQSGNVVAVEQPPAQRQREKSWAEVGAELLAELEERDRREWEEGQREAEDEPREVSHG